MNPLAARFPSSLAIALALLWLPGHAAALPATSAAPPTNPTPATSPAQLLAERYTPIVMLRKQLDPPCETSAEQYQPTSVDTVLGNPSVTLTRYLPGRGLRVVGHAPSASDIAGLGGDYYLDLPGKALGDTCVYARDFAALLRAGRAPAIVYAHIAREAGHPGFVVQYWFFWYFNQFNDLHEGDWEGMQIAFDASSPAQALTEEPSETVLFQHGGGERARWGDAKVQKRGTHMIVYPAAGSHATFYDSAVYVENGQGGSGLGCDNTTPPLRELRLRPVLLPEAPPASGAFAWLSYRGHWGEREKGYNNGPTGPNTKTQWTRPFAWMDAQRSTSPRLPGGSVIGPRVTQAFCGAVATASQLVNLDARSRPAAILTLFAIVLLLGLFVGLTRWRPVDLARLRARRSFGQIVRAAGRLYRRHARALVPVGLTALPIVGGVNLLANLLSGQYATGAAPTGGGVHLAAADLIETFARPVAEAIVAAVAIAFVHALLQSRPASFRSAYADMARRFWRVVLAQLLATAGVLALALTVIGLPWAVWKFIAWQFVQQEVLFTDRSILEAFHGSSALVRGRRWHTVRVAGFLWLLSVVVGPVLGFVLIFTNFSLTAINLLGSLVYALLIPYVALGRTLLYLDLQVRAEEQPAKPRRSWAPWRPRSFGRRPSSSPPAPAPAPGV
ncbi:MAG TPA: hypothetical protein VL972_09965 [Solirubrobacteraceae bacterium]|nr:hypothetical protein [Solirubrobacteraceae bacterium]